MEIAELRQCLVAMARKHGAESPEDTAHNVILKALTGRGLDHPPQYWYVAVRNECRDEYRRLKAITITDYEWQILEAPHDSMAERPQLAVNDDYRWLLDYYQRRQHTGAERIKAFRVRDRIRRRYAKEESRQVSGIRRSRTSHRDAEPGSGGLGLRVPVCRWHARN